MTPPWDLVIAGAGPAGAAAALGALRENPSLKVALLDRASFPRDKPCGDGVAPHVIDLLAQAGVTGLVDDQVPVRRLRLRSGRIEVDRPMAGPAWVIARSVLDFRLVQAAQAAGAELMHHRVRAIASGADGVVLDDGIEASVVVGADGAHSVIRAAVGGHSRGPTAIAVRGYAPTQQRAVGVQSIVFDADHQPAYAWSFDRGDGLANVGYGAVLKPGRDKPSRAHLLERLDALLPGSTAGAIGWKGHHLPLSGWGWRPSPGRVLLAGDAASLVNPLTGEGIYYAVATGLAAGTSAAEAIAARDPGSAGARYRKRTRPIGRQLRHTATVAAMCRGSAVLKAGLRASAADQGVFDDLVELGLAQGHITPTMLRGLVGAHRHTPTQAHHEETTACES